MITGALLDLLSGLFNGIFSALPSADWHLCKQVPCTGGVDGGMIVTTLGLIRPYDRFEPIHDGLLPIVALLILAVLGMLALKGGMYLVGLVRGGPD